MAYRRTAIRQFSLANRAYRNAVVTFSKVDPITLVPTGVPAVLYAEPYGDEVAINPYTMDAEGKFSVPLYVEEPVIAIVNASSVGVHQTGIIYPDSGGFKGVWATGTDYLPSEFVRDGAAGANTNNVYSATVQHTSGVWADDLAAGRWQIAIPATSVSLPGGVTGELDIAHGGTGASTSAQARANLGLGSAAEADATDFASASSVAGLVEDQIANGVTDSAPSQNAVFDALGQKLNTSALDTDASMAANDDSKIATQKATKAYTDAKVQDSITNGETAKAPSQNAVYDALALKIDSSYLDIDGTLAANSDVRIATQKAIVTYVAARIAALVDSSPATLDTLNELAAALADDPNFATTMTNALAGKQPLDALLTSLAGLTTAANKLAYFTGVDTAGLCDLSSWGRSLIAAADAAAGKAIIGTGITSGSYQATTSGTVIDWTGIPAGTKRITLCLNNVSLAGDSDLLVQIGDSGGIETSGYFSIASWTYQSSPIGSNLSSSGHLVRIGTNAYSATGLVTLVLSDAASNTWVFSHAVGYNGPVYGSGHGGGSKPLSSTLDRIRLTSVAGDAFDTGAVTILYE